MRQKTNQEWLQESEFTLALSSGFFGFFAHAGHLSALLDHGIVPAKVTGSSAGAIIGAFHAAGHSQDSIKKILYSIRRQDFWDPGIGVGLLKGKKLARILEDHLPADFSNLKTPLHVSTFDLTRMKTTVFSNGPHLRTSVRASCALPALFQPVILSGKILIDGAVADDLALSSVSSDERVLSHFLQSKEKPNAFDQWQLRKARSYPRLRMLKLFDRVPVGPYQLEKRPEAFQEAYSKTKNWLYDRPVG